jgi:hypothetical protein
MQKLEVTRGLREPDNKTLLIPKARPVFIKVGCAGGSCGGRDSKFLFSRWTLEFLASYSFY